MCPFSRPAKRDPTELQLKSSNGEPALQKDYKEGITAVSAGQLERMGVV